MKELPDITVEGAAGAPVAPRQRADAPDAPQGRFFAGNRTIDWKSPEGLADFREALALMRLRGLAIARGRAREMVWAVESKPAYSTGSKTPREDVGADIALPVYQTKRGGRVAYHGPGQLNLCIMMKLRDRYAGGSFIMKDFVLTAQQAAVDALGDLGVDGFARRGLPGVWTTCADGEVRKLAAVGFRMIGGVSHHGICINVDPDMAAYRNIAPCGMTSEDMTSLAEIGAGATLQGVEEAVRRRFEVLFGPTQNVDKVYDKEAFYGDAAGEADPRARLKDD